MILPCNSEKPKKNKSADPATIGFSLVEVSIAMGIVSVSLISLLGLLAGGMQVVRDASADNAVSAIVEGVRAELGQSDFQNVLTDFDGERWYFNHQGLRIPSESGIEDRYFELSFSVSDPNVVESADQFSESARRVGVKVRYPVAAADSAKTTFSTCFFLARKASR
jgi:uncharacterized protein (TIGR02598 family)